MTSAVVWKLPRRAEIWAAADSRVSAKRQEGDAKSITDQAVKVLPLEVTVRPPSAHADPVEPYGTQRLGLCYAGSVLPALMTYGAVHFFLSSLESRSGKFPDRENIADLVRVLSEQYICAATFASGIKNPAVCEFAIFGQTPADGGRYESWAYWIRPSLDTGVFKQVSQSIDLEAGDMVVLGDKIAELKADIAALQARRHPGWDGTEPRIALSNRIHKREHDTVGGTVQGAILKNNVFERFGSMYGESGNVFQNWLGFDYEKGIADILGVDVSIRALLG